MESFCFTIGLGSDHAGYKLKQELRRILEREGMQVMDIGTDSDLRTDYPRFAHAMSQTISAEGCRFGILVCGTGQGMAMTANKYSAVRAAVCWSPEIARLAREHNDANVLCLPARFLDTQEALQIIHTFLVTPFSGGRHLKRIRSMIPELE